MYTQTCGEVVEGAQIAKEDADEEGEGEAVAKAVAVVANKDGGILNGVRKG